MAAKMPITAMTTNNSINVNARRFIQLPCRPRTIVVNIQVHIVKIAFAVVNVGRMTPVNRIIILSHPNPNLNPLASIKVRHPTRSIPNSRNKRYNCIASLVKTAIKIRNIRKMAIRPTISTQRPTDDKIIRIAVNVHRENDWHRGKPLPLGRLHRRCEKPDADNSGRHSRNRFLQFQNSGRNADRQNKQDRRTNRQTQKSQQPTKKTASRKTTKEMTKP